MLDSSAMDLRKHLEQDLSSIKLIDWVKKIAATANAFGHFHPCGQHHFSAFVEGGDTLLVTFETMQGARALSETGRPLGWHFLQDHGWSHLGLFSNGDTWFRDAAMYEYFDQLSDDGFFDDFDKVLFYGAGPSGYAAAAFSVASPGARVVAVQPQATLSPDMADWDDRFPHMRRTDFTSRYGYAPDMLDAAHQAHILYDPYETLDAMHAALLSRENVTRYRLRSFGDSLHQSLLQMAALSPLLKLAEADELTPASLGKLLRRRHENPQYLSRLSRQAMTQDRPQLAKMVLRHAYKTTGAQQFRQRLQQLEDSQE